VWAPHVAPASPSVNVYTLAVTLVERDHEIEALRAAMREVASGAGRVIAITGEPGAGKSALVREACLEVPDMRVLRGACDPLSTPRPLGPFRDMAADLGHPWPEIGETAWGLAGFCEAVFEAVGAEPTVVVIEDAQWLDEASIDVIRFLLRRLESVPTLLLLTYRDGQVAAGHPLRPLLGDLARVPCASSISLVPLSLEAVALMLSESELEPAAVLALTGGNAFFVSEIAHHTGEGLPSSVRDAVLESASGLSDDDVEMLQLISTAPDGLDDRLLPVLGLDLPTLRRLDASGLLIRSRRGVAFRHELARLAVEGSIPVGGAARLHERILDGLEQLESSEYAVLTHHAVAALDGRRISRYAHLAAVDAIRAGSHSEAVAFLQLAISHHTGPLAERAELLQHLSFEQYMVGRLADAIESITAAQSLWGELGDRSGESVAFDRRATYEYYSGRLDLAEADAQRAAEVAKGADAALSYGFARSTRGYLAFRCWDFALASVCDREALDVAMSLHDDALRIRAEIIERASAVAIGVPSARTELLALVDEAMERSIDEIASMGLSNLVSIDVEQRRFRDADELLARSLPFTVERDIKICNAWQTAVRARLHLSRGRWAAALEDAHAVLDGDAPPLTLIWPHLVVGLVELRRSGGGAAHLELAWELAERVGEPPTRLAVLSALAERMWLTGVDDERVLAAHRSVSELAGRPGVEWALGDLCVWLERAGRMADAPVSVAEPFRLHLSGHPLDAAGWWAQAGAPFEQCLAEIASDDTRRQASGIDMLDALAAVSTADRCRQDLRTRGVVNLPARPRASTRANPAGLTNRQLEVARLVAQGLTNAELAKRLYISAKTADHHVSAVLSKLGLSSRREILRRAEEIGID
jgi:DNA-binding CsgD family transcriptional regulator/tetratricopeptide (TPR) repeat protein